MVDFPADSYGDDRKTRHIETRPQISHYTVETSVNGAELDAARKCCPRVLQRLLRICRHPCPVRPGDGRRTALTDRRCASAACGCSVTAKAQSPHRPKPPGLAWMHWMQRSLGSISKCTGAATSATALRPDNLYLSWLVYDADEVTLSTLSRRAGILHLRGQL